KVQNHKVGERCLVQTDYRQARTAANSNAAFGYNFEGGLQEYTIIDERLSVDAETGDRLLIPVNDDLSRSAVCLVEPWACVEDSYATSERQTIKAGGKLLVVAETGHGVVGLKESLSPDGPPAEITTFLCDEQQAKDVKEQTGMDAEATWNGDKAPLEALGEQAFDDVVYFGAKKSTLEALNHTLANECIMNVVTGGEEIGEKVSMGVGRLHYGMTRWIGTPTVDASDSYGIIPANGEIRDKDRIAVVGAGGPMGQMHVIRLLCVGKEALDMVATDFDDERLESLSALAQPLAEQNGHRLKVVNPQKDEPGSGFSYNAVMVPVPALVEKAIADADEGCLVNIFAGIPAPTIHAIDLDTVIRKRVFLFGTSGSTLADMKAVLSHVSAGDLDTNLSVDAVAGMAGGICGIKAVENRTLAGKIIVYPELHDLPLTPLEEIGKVYPSVGEKLREGKWTKEAEEELLKVAK
ncbi:MAG: alcohol dehydrogenase, partial [Candidatus Sumerlaeota bacterium]